MRNSFLVLLLLSLHACREHTTPPLPVARIQPSLVRNTATDRQSWTYFLQHLPEKKGPIVDFTGQPIAFQEKHTAIIDYDIGKRDLQQCADALIRLRAEYLFGQRRFRDIHFQFTSGSTYTYEAYCRGQRPLANGNKVRFLTTQATPINRQSFRRYLELVYAYAGTLSLAKELRNTDRFTTGTVVIVPGSPGHCFIICDEAVTPAGDTLYKLVEGYTPAQSIYVLKNLQKPQLGEWHRLTRGVIKTASYIFTAYQLKAFE